MRLGVLPGSFNPPTVAHLELARAALDVVDEVVFVLPRVFPHKDFEGAGFEDRLRMLRAAVAGWPRFSVAVSEGGLFLDIARECRAAYGPDTRLFFLCGRDAAERIVNWDYGRPGAFAGMLEEFELLVAARDGGYDPPASMRERIHALATGPSCEGVSATEVRRRIAAGEPWEHLVPPPVVPLAGVLYRS